MLRPTRSQLLALAALSAMVVAAACGGSDNNGPDCGSGSPPDLSGEYHLVLYHAGGSDIPGATGQLHLGTPTGGNGNYTADLDLLATEVHDTGVYFLTGTKCIRQESTSGNGTTDGTYTREADTVSVTGTSSQISGSLISRWVLDPS